MYAGPSEVMTPSLINDIARQQFLAYLSAVFSAPTAREIEGHLRELNPPAPFRIRMKALYSRGSVESTFTEMTRAGLFKRLTDSGAGFSFSAVRGTEIDSLVYFAVMPSSVGSVSIVVAVCEREEWHLLLRAVKKEYPSLVPVYLSQRELLESISYLRNRLGDSYNLRVREISAREKVQTPEGLRTKTIREWTYEAWEKAVSDVSERRQIVSTISVAFHRRLADKIDIVPAAICKVSKWGEVDFTGRYDLIWSSVVLRIAEVGEKKLSFYSKRGLRETSFKAAPLAITYAAPIFSDVGEIRRLVTALTRYPRSMHSVQHGNPYAYVHVADAYDGSSFDVWAVTADSITILPRLKATEAAVDRLIRYIFDAFREGAVGDYAAG